MRRGSLLGVVAGAALPLSESASAFFRPSFIWRPRPLRRDGFVATGTSGVGAYLRHQTSQRYRVTYMLPGSIARRR
jgi:hypothetical protein